jgi:hypothetical protein
MLYGGEMPVIAFRKRVEIKDIKLADIHGPWSVVDVVGQTGAIEYSFGTQEKVLPPALEDLYTWAIIPTSFPHPSKTFGVDLNDDVFCRMGILDIGIYLQ